MYSNGQGVFLSDNQRRNILEYKDRAFLLKPLHENVFGSKGGNSSIFILEDSNSGIDKIVKFCKFPLPDEIEVEEYMQLTRKDQRQYTFNKKRNSRFSNEVAALKVAKELKFENVVSISFDGERIVSGYRFKYFVMEKADTDLKDFILANKGLGNQERLGICVDIMRAVKQLHGETIYHRDIKPDNILLFNVGKRESGIKRWKISDLGLIQNGGRESLDDIGEKIGPYGWLSPEAMNKYLTEEIDFGHDCEIDECSDIFQLGKVFWFIFQGNVPIGQIDIDDFNLEVVEKELLFKIIKQMLEYTKAKRIKMEELERKLQIVARALGFS